MNSIFGYSGSREKKLLISRLDGAFGLKSISLGPRPLMAHMKGIARLLSRWGGTDTVVTAGLCHSLYENEPGYWRVTPNRTNRMVLRKLIGKPAERLVYFFPWVRSQNFETPPSPDKRFFILRNPATGERARVTKNELTNLFLITLANFVEQIAYFDFPSRKRIMSSPTHLAAKALLRTEYWASYERDAREWLDARPILPPRNQEARFADPFGEFLSPSSAAAFFRSVRNGTVWHGQGIHPFWGTLVAKHTLLGLSHGLFKGGHLTCFSDTGKTENSKKFRRDLHYLIRNLESFDDNVARFAAMLGGILRRRVSCNAYLTPPKSQTFPMHWDGHDVLILQLRGSKRWTLLEPAIQPPHRFKFGPESASLFAKLEPRDARLRPGDFLYLPKGLPHQARTGAGASLHLTFGLHETGKGQ